MSEISEIVKMTNMPTEAENYVEEAFAKIKADPALFSLLKATEAHHMQSLPVGEEAAELAEKAGLHRYTVDLLILLYSCLRLRRKYRAHGYSEEMFAETLPASLGYATEMCMKLHGVVGNFFFSAYRTMFDCTRFSFGRLHLELARMPFDYKDIVKKGDAVLACHIPASGPLLTEEVEESLKRAYDFFNVSGPLVVVCSSWLLYPPFYEEVYGKGSNLSRFYELFDVVEAKERPFTADGWRVFGRLEADPDKLPRDTSLQRSLCNFLKKGNSMGGGYGVLIRNYEK